MDACRTEEKGIGNTTVAPLGMPLLARVQRPADVRLCTPSELTTLAAEMRAFLIRSVTRTGGHLGAALGVVELAVALCAELDLDGGDALIWDVGHQCYPHKLLTGRADRF